MKQAPIHILVVDDDSFLQECLSHSLTSNGHEVKIANNGREALAVLAADKSINLVISDLRMPVMDGVEFRLEMLNRHIDCPFILTTGNPELISKDILQKLSLQALLVKPYPMSELEESIEALRN